MPIDALEYGVYSWFYVTATHTYGGHVVVRAEQADAVAGWPFDEGTETWFYDSVTSGGGTGSFTLELELKRDSEDSTLEDAVDAILENEVELGAMNIAPDWDDGSPMDGSAPVMTLTSCLGPSSCSDGFERISIQMSDPDTEMPTFYADDAAIVSLFSGESSSFTMDEGDKAILTVVDARDDGFPDGGWVWVGYGPQLRGTPSQLRPRRHLEQVPVQLGHDARGGGAAGLATEDEGIPVVLAPVE